MTATAELFSCLKAPSAALPAAVGSQDTATTEGIISFSVVEKFAKPCHSKRPLARDTVLRRGWKAQQRKCGPCKSDTFPRQLLWDLLGEHGSAMSFSLLALLGVNFILSSHPSLQLDEETAAAPFGDQSFSRQQRPPRRLLPWLPW